MYLIKKLQEIKIFKRKQSNEYMIFLVEYIKSFQWSAEQFNANVNNNRKKL